MLGAVLNWCENHHNAQPLDIRLVEFDDKVVNTLVKQFDQIFKDVMCHN